MKCKRCNGPRLIHDSWGCVDGICYEETNRYVRRHWPHTCDFDVPHALGGLSDYQTKHDFTLIISDMWKICYDYEEIHFITQRKNLFTEITWNHMRCYICKRFMSWDDIPKERPLFYVQCKHCVKSTKKYMQHRRIILD